MLDLKFGVLLALLFIPKVNNAVQVILTMACGVAMIAAGFVLQVPVWITRGVASWFGRFGKLEGV